VALWLLKSLTMRTKNILVATDFSDLAEAAVRLAADLARQSDARLHVLHVTSSREYEVTSLLMALAGEIGSGIEVTTATAAGDPAEEIIRYARRKAVDLIVVGTHGRTGVSRALLGSVAERLVRTAHRPVLTVPSMEAAEPTPTPGEPLRAPTGGHCLVCAELSADLVCEPCRARIRGEALQREERTGRI
jgi:nucleotide-binding universal stress UspA family protein